MEAKNPYFVAKSCWKSSYFVYLFCPKNDAIDFTKWFHNNSAMGGRRKLPDPLLNRIFNALSIGVHYTLSFQWINFGLKCLFRQIKKRNMSYGTIVLLTSLLITLTRHFRPKLIHWNKSVYCTPIDRALKMRFNEGSGNQPFLSYEGFCEINCAVFWTK